jgi:hypothetical protein
VGLALPFLLVLPSSATAAPQAPTAAPPGTRWAPTPVTVTKDDAAHTATLTWAVTDESGGQSTGDPDPLPITGWRITRDGTDSAGQGPLAQTLAATTLTTTFTKLAVGRSYTVTVAPVNAAGVGERTTVPVVMAGAPGAPLAVAATSPTSSTATLTWTAPRAPGGFPVTGYKVARNGSDASGKGSWSTVLPATRGYATFTKLVPGRTYRLSVAAINALGQSSTVSADVLIVPTAQPGGDRVTATDTDVVVDPSRTSFVLTNDDGSKVRYPLPATASYVWQRRTGLSREDFLSHLAGHHDFVRVDYLTGEETPEPGIVEYAITGTGPYTAQSGEFHEQYDDYGSDVDIDPTGTLLTLGTYGYDPTYADDVPYVDAFTLDAASTYRFELRQSAENGFDGHSEAQIDYGQVSREDFVRLYRGANGTRAIDISYDAATGMGAFRLIAFAPPPV